MGYIGNSISSIKIKPRIVILLIVLLLVSLGVNIGWTMASQQSQAEQEMLEKARILSYQMSAVWEFMDMNQTRIDTDSDGTYNFKGIYCAIAGKSIAALFARDTNYLIKYTNTTPRKESASPDEFEAEAFAAFDSGAVEYYGVSNYDGESVFRYVSPVRIKESCLSCHGSPAGELDVTGYPKEGKQIGDLGGAISIVMPIDLYMQGVQGNIVRQSVYFFAIVLILIGTVYIAVSYLITRPLGKLESAVEDVESGNLDIDLGEMHAAGEMLHLAKKFESMAKQLRDSYSDLENKVETRTAELAAANERLRDESQYKSDFLAIMSHELRTPLTAILAYTELWEKAYDYKDEKERSIVMEIEENGQLLLQMVNNILEAARAEAGKTSLSCEYVDIFDLIDTVEGTVGPLAARREIDLATYVHGNVPIVYADWEKLRRIVENLASNAIKFTHRGGIVRIEARFWEERNEMSIEVSDNGIGISDEDLPRIFEHFTQSDKSANRRYGGSGLGLAVVKSLVDAHGGRVEVSSKLKRGSTFSVFIPVQTMTTGEDE